MTTRKEKNLAQALNQQREARIAKLLEAGACLGAFCLASAAVYQVLEESAE